MSSLINSYNSYYVHRNASPARIAGDTIGTLSILYIGYKFLQEYSDGGIQGIKRKIMSNLLSLATKLPGTGAIIQAEKDAALKDLKSSMLNNSELNKKKVTFRIKEIRIQNFFFKSAQIH